MIGGALLVKVEFFAPGEGIGGSPSPRLGRMISSSSPRSLLLLLTLKIVQFVMVVVILIILLLILQNGLFQMAQQEIVM